jgi:hypothetical protein
MPYDLICRILVDFISSRFAILILLIDRSS